MKKRNFSVAINIAALALPAILTILVLYFIVLLSRYTEVSLKLIILVSIALIALVLLIDLLSSYGFYTKKPIFKYIAIGLALIMTLATAYGCYYLKSVNDSINEIIVDGTETEVATVAFVTYDNNKLTSIDDFSSSTVFGYIDNEAFQEGNVLALEEIENQNLDVKLAGYDSYNELLLALFNDDVDVAALPDNYYEMFVVNDGYEDYLDKTNVIHTYSKEIDANGVDTVDKDLTTEPFTVLLMGLDEQRTDTLILATFNPERMTVTMTSIARDSFVPIACYTNEQSDKVNAARVVSRSCTIQTVENLLGVDVDFFVEVNFQGIVDIVDALGGLWLNSPVEFVGQTSSYNRGSYTVWVNEGYQLMDGEQVLAFARERHHMPNGDFSRQENQQQIITTLATTLLEMKDASKALAIIQAAGANISTNFSLKQMTQLLNFGIDKLANTYVGQTDGSVLFNIITTRIYGYDSWTYNEGLQLPLWIYKLYNGSITDNVAIIKRNLQIDTELKEYYDADFDISTPYYLPTSYVASEYDETQIHEQLPDFMKAMVNNQWTLEDVQEWLSTRTWINLEVTYVKSGDALYSDSLAHHTVVYQSVKYGVKTSNITTLQISVIQKDLDCSLEANQSYLECSSTYIVPKFVGMTLSELATWKSNHSGVSVSTVTIDNSSTVSGVTYDSKYAGKIGAQSASQYTKWDTINNSITVYYFDYPTLTLDVDAISGLSGETAVLNWFSSNWNRTPTISYVYSDTAASGSVISISKTSDGTVYSANIYLNSSTGITVVISKGNTVTVPNLLGQSYSAYSDYMSGLGLSAASAGTTTITDPDTQIAGTIATQSVDAGDGVPFSAARGLTVTVYAE